MTLILDGKVVADNIQQNLKIFFGKPCYQSSYLAIIMLGNDHPGLIYVKLKHYFARQLWLWCHIYGSVHLDGDGVDYSYETLIKKIDNLNNDPNCIGIIIQQPLPPHLLAYKGQILSRIHPSKDCDWLGGILFGLDSIDRIKFVPATPGATINLLKYYQLDQMRGKTIVILWQSNLIGKPLAMYCIKQGATVISFNSKSPQTLVKKICHEADYILSATGVVHLIDETYLSDRWDQIIIDIGRWLQDGKAVGDIDRKSCVDKCYALAKVPWWVWPVTVANLFDNIRILQSLSLSRADFKI